MLRKSFTLFGEKTAERMMIVGGALGLASLSYAADSHALAEFKKQHPGVKPTRKWHYLPGAGGYYTYERPAEEASPPSLRR